jgi:hypothetical protein
MNPRELFCIVGPTVTALVSSRASSINLSSGRILVFFFIACLVVQLSFRVWLPSLLSSRVELAYITISSSDRDELFTWWVSLLSPLCLLILILILFLPPDMWYSYFIISLSLRTILRLLISNLTIILYSYITSLILISSYFSSCLLPSSSLVYLGEYDTYPNQSHLSPEGGSPRESGGTEATIGVSLWP